MKKGRSDINRKKICVRHNFCLPLEFIPILSNYIENTIMSRNIEKKQKQKNLKTIETKHLRIE